jgi:hypothetical protein
MLIEYIFIKNLLTNMLNGYIIKTERNTEDSRKAESEGIMIIIETDRIYCIYVRTNRRTKWQYAEYGGRWETVEKAIEKMIERMGDASYEYRITTIDGEIIKTGFMNWNKIQKGA